MLAFQIHIYFHLILGEKGHDLHPGVEGQGRDLDAGGQDQGHAGGGRDQGDY